MVLRLFCFLLFFVFCLSNIQYVIAQSSKEIGAVLTNKENEFNELKKKIKEIEEKSNSILYELNTNNSELEKLNKELNYYENEIEKINLLKQKSLLELEIYKYRKDELNLLQNITSKISYKNWRLNNLLKNNAVFLFNNKYDLKRYEKYNDIYVGNIDLNIVDISNNIFALDNLILQSNNELNSFNEIKQKLSNRKIEIQNNLALLTKQNYAYQQEYLSISNNIDKLKSDITFLSNEQKKAIEREMSMLANANPGNNNIITLRPGDFYIAGNGRDLYQGHGVGMSQFGAHGAALNGYSYDQIIKFYYQGVQIEDIDHNRNILVNGYGYINLEDYVSGQGEVPSYACGTQEKINEWQMYSDAQGWDTNDPRRKKYVLDDASTIWDCWPEEAIKAQVIAFRTYALHYVSRKGSICTTAACQVYKNNKNSSWASEETKGKVITYNGELIEALYSSDNNQGFGTANNDTVFTNFYGDGTPYPYLRSVNDNAFATKTFYSNWTYNTKNYTLNDIFEMLNYIAFSNNSDIDNYDGFVRNNTKLLLQGVSGISSLSLELDPSNRVKKIFITFDNGNIKSVSGYWFKYMWNIWSFYTQKYDYIYSQTFRLLYE